MELLKYLILYVICYFLCMTLGIVFQNVYLCFFIGGLFSMGSVWFVYYMMTHKTIHTKPKENKKIIYKKPFVKPERQERKEKPDENDNIYEGVIISESKQYTGQEKPSWFSETNTQLDMCVKDIENMLKGDE